MYNILHSVIQDAKDKHMLTKLIVVRSTIDLTISEILNNELSMVNNWLKVNKLSLKIKKVNI